MVYLYGSFSSFWFSVNSTELLSNGPYASKYWTIHNKFIRYLIYNQPYISMQALEDLKKKVSIFWTLCFITIKLLWTQCTHNAIGIYTVHPGDVRLVHSESTISTVLCMVCILKPLVFMASDYIVETTFRLPNIPLLTHFIHFEQFYFS